MHRYRFDCWRFYPESWAPLSHIAGLEIVETFFETDRNALRVPGAAFRDSCVIARKPLRTTAETKAFNQRNREMKQYCSTANPAFQTQPFEIGPCFERYEQELSSAKPVQTGMKAMIRRLLGGKPPSVFNPKNNI